MWNYQLLVLTFFVVLSTHTIASPQGELVRRWANRIGEKLWNLGTVITNRQDIENRYETVNLETKDPKKIIEEIVGNVSFMMKKKMDAVNCIIERAEKAAQESLSLERNETDSNFTYYISNPPALYDQDVNTTEEEDEYLYREMTWNVDTHFFNLPVNTNYSSVHVPINVYHKHKEPQEVIEWSESLDEVFQANYNADPALSWQYFGSSTGIMRHYPAMLWKDDDRGLFDCRIRTWFIEAATCTKDVIILLDNSGSMTGMNKHIGSLVVNTILDTLSNNDYINTIHYSEWINYTIPCFTNSLVQATEENIVVFKNAIQMLKPENKSHLDTALVEAFRLLYEYRAIRNCNLDSKYCNQAIMIVTDGVASNVQEIIDRYNRLKDAGIPIRIFTFIVGKEATHLSDAVEIACGNRGYHSHVDALEQVTAAVYNYILVFARPLVLHGKNPLSWTHAYYDLTHNFEDKRSDKYRLLTSVAGPVLDKSQSENETKTAKLLGVAGTDVPIAEIAKLMYPYKTGVNSHSFIVSNNGYVLKHPDLRPMFEGNLTDNYNSIDVSEVEQLDDDLQAREVEGVLLELRDALVEGEEGVMHDLKIKYHYDDMRRVSREINDYFYAPINGTPFSIGFAIPDLYGNYSIEVGDEIELHRFSTVNISSFFNGSTWKIHPKWVYCKYHYLEGHEYETPEQELVHFVNRMNTDDFKWSMQYEIDSEQQKHDSTCGAKNLGNESYYCDRNLVQKLVFDAKLTKTSFDVPWKPQTPAAENLRLQYNAQLRFIATMSGLTRWEYLETFYGTTPFGELHSRAVDEVWYKSAVIQKRYNDKSFVYSVPFDYEDDEDIQVTGSYAIFPTELDETGEIISAPAAVVGFQFSHSHLMEQFFSTTGSSQNLCEGCLSCENGLECYVVDSSGYIVIAKDREVTGKFFGEIDGAIMEAMIREQIFENITVRDYQAICYYHKWVKGNASNLMTPLVYLYYAMHWFLSQIVWFAAQLNVYTYTDSCWNTNAYTIRDLPTSAKAARIDRCNKKCNEDEERWHEENKIPKYTRQRTACEKERDLYILQQYKANLYPDGISPIACNRPFYLAMLKHSNLLLIAINTSKGKSPTSCHYIHTTRTRDIVYKNESNFPCQKLYLNKLKRRPLQGCYNEHPLEQEVKACGGSHRIVPNIPFTVIIIVAVVLSKTKY